MTQPPELDTQVPELQCGVGIQFFTSLLRRRGGWVANHALQRTRSSRSGCNPRVLWAGSPSLGRLGGKAYETLFTIRGRHHRSLRR